MNFLSFRDQIYDWTLNTDQNLFSQVNQLTDYIFQTQQNITQSIAITRSALNESSTILNNNFNHYLRLSENKFTENKIAEPKKSTDENSKKEEVTVEPKSKMDIFKEALNISIKNLEIKEEEKQTDNVSISELSLSQAIFRNARLPPYFGSKEFRAQKFLNLFFDEDLGSEILSKKEIQSLSNKPLSTPSQDNSSTSIGSNNNNISSGYLPPPPSLQSLNLGFNNNFSSQSGNIPPPLIPPPLNLLPPPPLPPGLVPPPPLGLSPPLTLPSTPSIPPARQSVVIDDQDENKQLLESILVSTRGISNPSSEIQNSHQSSPSQQPAGLPQPPKPIENKPLTFQEELALKLKLGKDYKPPAKVIETVKPQTRQQPKRQPQTTFQRANSFRQSTKIEDIIGGPSKTTSKQQARPMFADDDQEEENALFGSGKRKTTSQTEVQTSKFGISKNQADAMMSRSTFNEDMLFKKKPVFSKESVLPTKNQEKPKQKEEKRPNRASVLFNQDSDEEQQNFTFKKKTIKKQDQKKPEQEPPQKKTQQKKSNPLGLAQKPEAKEKIADEPKKKNINKLFGGNSDEDEDIFAKKKPMAKKESETSSSSKTIETQPKVIEKPTQKVPEKPSNPLAQPKATKKNSLFNNDEEEQDFAFKPKQKPAVKKESKKEEKKSSLFAEDDDDDSVFKPKPKVVKKQEEEIIKPKTESPQKSKGLLFSSIPQEENEQGSGIFIAKKTVQPEPKPEEKIQKTSQPLEEEESEEAKRMKRITRMGGQPMMGMAQMIPKGMNITKPSETKENQKIARENLEHEKQIHSRQTTEATQPKRQLDPLEKLITQTIQPVQTKIEEQKKQTLPVVEPKRELDPLEKLINITVNKKDEQKQVLTQPKQLPKPQPPKIQEEKLPQTNNAPQMTLEVRRKKNKPKRNDDDFFDDDEKQAKKPVPSPRVKQANEVKQEKQEKPEPPKEPKKNPLIFSVPTQNSQKSSQIDKIAKMSMAGMPQMGMGPLMMPKGVVITKPSQAKKLQQQALERLKNQEEERAKRQQQEQREKQQLKLQQEANQRLRQEQQLKLQQEANQRLRQQQEELQRKEKQAKEQQERERQQKLLHEQQERQRIAYEEEVRRQRMEQEAEKQRQLQEQQKRRVEEERERQRKAEEEQLKKQKSNLPSLTVFDSGPKNSSNPLGGKPKQSGPLDVPKMPPKVNPLGGGSSSKSPLGGPLGTSQKSTGLLSGNSGLVPPMPAINREAPKNTGKKSLFDDDQDDGFTKKKEQTLPKASFSNANEKKKPSLFADDDDDSGFGFGSKAKPKKNTTSKKGLFDDDEDEGFGFGKKAKKPEPKEPIMPPSIIQSKQEQKPAQKANLLNNDSDDDDMFGKKKATSKEPIKPTLAPQKAPEQIRPHVPAVQQKPKNKKSMFGNSDSDSDGGFGKKKIDKKPAQVPPPTTNILIQNQPKSVPQKQVKSKKGLFGSSDDEEETRKPSKPTIVKETKPVASKPTAQKKGLFDGSDDESDDAFKPKAQKKPEPVKPAQNQPLIPSKKTQIPASSPLSASKSSNPMGLLSSPLQSKPSPLQQPVQAPKQNPVQQKKKNLFEDSDQEPTPVQKAKVIEQPQKKGLIEEDSQQEKPKVAVKQPEPEVSKPAQTNNNRRLFDDSEQDSDAEEAMRKKRMANNKLKKLF